MGSALWGAAPGTGPGSARGPAPHSPSTPAGTCTPQDARVALCTASLHQHIRSREGEHGCLWLGPQWPPPRPPRGAGCLLRRWSGRVLQELRPWLWGLVWGLTRHSAGRLCGVRRGRVAPLNPGPTSAACIRAAGGGRPPPCARLAWDSPYPQPHTRLYKSHRPAWGRLGDGAPETPG